MEIKLNKKQRLSAYRYAFRDIKEKKTNLFMCWRLKSYLVAKNLISAQDILGVDYDELMKSFPELYRKRPLAIKQNLQSAWYDTDEKEKRLAVLRRCINNIAYGK